MMRLVRSINHTDGSIEKYFDDGTISWYKNGEIHRENGHAVEFDDGTKKWLINGKLHREDGPAIEWARGKHEWYLNDKQLSEEEFNSWKLQRELTKELSLTKIKVKKPKV